MKPFCVLNYNFSFVRLLCRILPLMR